MLDIPVPAASAFSAQDQAGTVRTLGPWWALMVAGIDPAPVMPLAVEQIRALAATLGVAPPLDDDPIDTIGVLAGRLDHEGPDPHRAGPGLDDLVVTSLTLLRRAGRTLAAAGAFAPASGSVQGLFRSDGGVPKLPVATVLIGDRGVVGDRQRSRRHHGRVWQALCLWSKEKVDLLRQEGHPIDGGAAGENISVGGVDWVLVRPGTRVRLGSDVLAEVSVPALPCTKNARWFVAGDFMRMHHERQAGISRMYATVLRSGSVAVGDPVELEG